MSAKTISLASVSSELRKGAISVPLFARRSEFFSSLFRAFQGPALRDSSFGLREDFNRKAGFKHDFPEFQLHVWIVSPVENGRLRLRHESAFKAVKANEFTVRPPESPLCGLKRVYSNLRRAINHLIQFFRRIHCGELLSKTLFCQNLSVWKMEEFL